MPEKNSISPKDLNSLIGTPNVPEIVDVCVDVDFDDDPYLIPCSWRHPYCDVDGLTEKLDGKPAVIVCQKGMKLSQGVTALLNARGIYAQFLTGGMYGWRDQTDTMRIPFQAIPLSNLWVTYNSLRIDDIACAWLIRRFVDRTSEFLFVAPEVSQAVVEKFNANPLSFDDVRAARTSETSGFDRMRGVFALDAPALDRMALVIKGTISNQHPIHSAAPGLLALAVGVTHQYQDNHMRLSAGFMLFDALYAWASDGYEKGQDWPGERS